MQLQTLLLQRIAQDGPMPFERFMGAALYEPGLGYYAGSATMRAGRSGDFYTNVSVGALYGQCLARQFAQMWHMAGAPAAFYLVEQGAMDGRLALDVLAGLKAANAECFAAVRMVLIDPYAPKRVAVVPDSAAASDVAARIFWQKELSASAMESVAAETGYPVDFVILYSNELVDAFPVCLIRYEGGGWKELHVVATESLSSPFCFVALPCATPGLAEAIARFQSAAESELPGLEGYTTEINLRATEWIQNAARLFPRGYLVTIDYGLPRRLYYSVERPQGTLRCFHKHRRSVDPLANVGQQDITADVDFTLLAEKGRACGLRVEGFVDQQRFLMGNAPPLFAMEPSAADVPPEVVATPEYRAQLRAWQALTHPSMMGAKFHVLIQSKNMAGASGPDSTDEKRRLSGLRFARPMAL